MKSKEIKEFRKTYTKYEKECVFEGYKLAVLFDEKDDVKRYGGRWNQEEKTWWMPASKLLDQIHDNGTLVRDWLNDNEMIVGQYGDFDLNEHRENYFTKSGNKYTEYKLGTEGRGFWQVRMFFEEEVTTFTYEATTEYLTVENGRKRWDYLIENGYNRVENS